MIKQSVVKVILQHFFIWIITKTDRESIEISQMYGFLYRQEIQHYSFKYCVNTGIFNKL